MIAERSGIIDRLKGGTTTIDDFNYDKLSAPPLSMLLNQYDIDRLYNIATSVRYAGNVRKKYKAIDEILLPRDFIKLSAGTNRLCYKFQHDDSFVIKVAYDSIAIQDSPAEFINQYTLKPFCTKVFEVDPCGVVGSFERVDPITSREEFVSVADDVYELIDNWLLSSGHIMADIGTKYFMNYGLRRGFGVVVIDFPYLYEIDGNKIFCTSPDNNSDTGICGGIIDFDSGFNELYCEKCGTRYRVKEISKNIEEGKILVRGNERRKERMKLKITVGGVDITKRDDRIDGFGPDASKVTTPNNNSGRVAIKKVPRGNNRHYVYNNSGQGRTVTVPNARTNDNQKQRNGYTKPCGSSTGSVKITRGSQTVKPSRPLPERGNQTQQNQNTAPQSSSAAESRGKAVIPATVADYDALNPIGPETVREISEGEKRYIMADTPTEIAIDDKTPLKHVDSIMEKLEAAEKSEYYWKSEAEKYKKMAEESTAELEQTKADLEATENLAASTQKSYEEITTNYNDLLEVNHSLEESCQLNRKTIDDLNANIRDSIADIDSLNKKIMRLEEAAENATKIDPEEYISVDDFNNKMLAAKKHHESEIASKNMQLDEMDRTIRDISSDLYEFCEFTIKSDDFFLTPAMKPNTEFVPEQIEGTSNVNACIVKISELRKLNEGEDDRFVLALMFGEDYLSSTDGKFVIASTVGGISVDNLVVNGFENIISEELFNRYFAETEEGGEENTTESETSETERGEQPELEHVEGEVISNDDAEAANAGEN